MSSSEELDSATTVSFRDGLTDAEKDMARKSVRLCCRMQSNRLQGSRRIQGAGYQDLMITMLTTARKSVRLSWQCRHRLTLAGHGTMGKGLTG